MDLAEFDIGDSQFEVTHSLLVDRLKYLPNNSIEGDQVILVRAISGDEASTNLAANIHISGEEKVEEEIENLKNVRPAVQASPTSAAAVAAQPVPTATSYSASAYNASDLWLGIPRGAWRDYDNEFDGARSKPRSVWPLASGYHFLPARRLTVGSCEQGILGKSWCSRW